MTKFFKKSLMIFMVILIILLSLGSIYAENGIDTANDGSNVDDSVQDSLNIPVDIDDSLNDDGDNQDLVSQVTTPDEDSEPDEGDNLASIDVDEDDNDDNAADAVIAASDDTNDNQAPVASTSQTPVAASVGTFSELQDEINGRIEKGKTSITLEKDYKYDKSADARLNDELGDYIGINIKNKFTIYGNGHSIDGSGITRIIHINGDCTVTLDSVTLKNGYCTDSKTYHQDGAAVYAGKNTKLTIKNCIFQNNHAYNADGAAIFANTQSTISIYNSQFINNNAERYSNLEWKKYKRGMGVVLVGTGSTLTMSGTTFKNNKAYTGIIVVVSYNDRKYALSTAKVINCKFEKNTANTNGVFYLDELSSGYFKGSTFKGNKVTSAGSILMLDTSRKATIEKCVFDSNSAVNRIVNLGKFDGQVPGFSKNSVSKVTIVGSTFKNNKAKEHGGAIFSNSGKLTIKNSKFIGNSAKKGGAIFASKGVLKLYSSTFSGNKAKQYGGAIFATTKAKNVVDSNCKYKGNKAGKSGKHVYGVFAVKSSVVSAFYGSVVMKGKVATPWKLLKSQKLGFKLVKGKKEFYSSVKKTNSKGIVVVKVPGTFKIGKYKAHAFSHEGTINAKAITVKVAKAPCKVAIKKKTIKPKHDISAKLINSKTKFIVSGIKLKVTVSNRYVSYSYNAMSNAKGIFKIALAKLAPGVQNVKVTSRDSNVIMKNYVTTIKIK